MNREEWERTHQHFEAAFWGDCANTYGEETKQIAYAKVMGLDPGPWRGGVHWPVWDMAGRSVIDVGGGPSSMLLKCSNVGECVVVDPCDYPAWTRERYADHGVVFVSAMAEDYLRRRADAAVDEAWCYNVLQHTLDPELIVREMRRVAKVLRMFEWVDEPPSLGHPHEFSIQTLQSWCGGEGHDIWVDETYGTSGSPVARAWGGVF